MASLLYRVVSAPLRNSLNIELRAQVGLHQKPVGLLNLRHYFDPLLALVENARREGFIYPGHQSLFLHSEQPETLLEAMEHYTERYASPAARWVDRDG